METTPMNRGEVLDKKIAQLYTNVREKLNTLTKERQATELNSDDFFHVSGHIDGVADVLDMMNKLFKDE